MPELTVISLGWGVQSWTLAAMAALGELPPVDFAVHSDTRHEHAHTYAFAAEMTGWLEQHGVPVVTVRAGQSDVVRTSPKSGKQYTIIPVFTLADPLMVPPSADEDEGSMFFAIDADDETVYSALPETAGTVAALPLRRGQMRRQCTSRWKIEPLHAWLGQELKRRGIGKAPGVVEQWIGISLDEFQRARTAPLPWLTNIYPLLEQRMTRQDCVRWLQAHNLPVPGKSSCTFCPYHNATAWQELKRNDGADWQEALAVDNVLREIRPGHVLYLHSKRVPLDQAVGAPTHAQSSLWDSPVEDAPCDNGGCFI